MNDGRVQTWNQCVRRKTMYEKLGSAGILRPKHPQVMEKRTTQIFGSGSRRGSKINPPFM